MEENDAQLQLKKRARRRLVGAVVFVSLVAVVLPMVMDQEQRPAVQDVEIRIPGQDDKVFTPKFAAAPVEKPAVASERPARTPEAEAVAEKPTARVIDTVAPARAGDKSADTAPAKVAEKPLEKTADKPAEKPHDKPADKPADKPKAAEKPAERKPEKVADKPAEKAPEKAADKASESKRAAAILGGAAGDAAPAPARSGEFLILIGAFSNEGNVKTLKGKLGELGIKVYTEPLDTPQGKKTRVRAGPFASREAADKALQKMQHIGVSGVVAAK